MALKSSPREERTPRQALVVFGMAIVLTILGVAGLILHSFAYPLALLLAALAPME